MIQALKKNKKMNREKKLFIIKFYLRTPKGRKRKDFTSQIMHHISSSSKNKIPGKTFSFR